ncbi:MAG: hypothetical protein KJS74_08885, partial [Rhodospirillales bacterium]|nr:hypothetical protein [Rhodospirillales bacterium]
SPAASVKDSKYSLVAISAPIINVKDCEQTLPNQHQNAVQIPAPLAKCAKPESLRFNKILNCNNILMQSLLRSGNVLRMRGRGRAPFETPSLH